MNISTSLLRRLSLAVCVSSLLACSASGTTVRLLPGPDDAGDSPDAMPSARDDGGDAGPSHGNVDAGGGKTSNGTLSFVVDGRSFEADDISITEASGYYTLTGKKTDPDGIDYDAVTIRYATSASGSSACGIIFGTPDGAITYGRYFHDGGQVATEKQYLSGLPGGASCNITISAHRPEAGSVSGSLTSDKALTGGGGAPPPVSIAIHWSGVKP